ncbi:hypothetical protein LZ32DRAFT_651335 [Colletotrichum eremochloae]|nr:hypothetical protein LZ32DRAFT_651335 [Colletotrichum eremochloae]
MQSIYPLLLLLWSLSCTFVSAAPARFTPPSPPPGLDPRKPLRYAGDTYTVETRDDKYIVYTPYYGRNNNPVTTIIFPNGKNNQMIIPIAYNGMEQYHRDQLHLSDMIQAVANYAHKSLTSIEWVLIRNLANRETVNVIDSYYGAHPEARYNDVTIKPSDSYWRSFQSTPFFKAANRAFSGKGKTVAALTSPVVHGGRLRLEQGGKMISWRTGLGDRSQEHISLSERWECVSHHHNESYRRRDANQYWEHGGISPGDLVGSGVTWPLLLPRSPPAGLLSKPIPPADETHHRDIMQPTCNIILLQVVRNGSEKKKHEQRGTFCILPRFHHRWALPNIHAELASSAGLGITSELGPCSKGSYIMEANDSADPVDLVAYFLMLMFDNA